MWIRHWWRQSCRIGAEPFLRCAVKAVEEQYDVVLIDSPPNVGKLAALGTLASDVLKVRSVQDQASSVRVWRVPRSGRLRAVYEGFVDGLHDRGDAGALPVRDEGVVVGGGRHHHRVGGT